MKKLRAALVKDMRILTRDWVGLSLMFAMPILLVIVITSLQNNTFELVNDHKVPMIIYNDDQDIAGQNLSDNLTRMGMFEVIDIRNDFSPELLQEDFSNEDILVALYIPKDFTASITRRSKQITSQALIDLGISQDKPQDAVIDSTKLSMFYNPVLQENYKFAIRGTIEGALQLVENKQMIKSLYGSLGEEEIPEDMESQMMNRGIQITEEAVTKDGSGMIPNATQHNVPAWTIFAMFFIVTSLGSNIVLEKTSGSFIRLKTMPTAYYISLISKQLTYLGVTFLQVAVIFTIGIVVFPFIGLPELNLPKDIFALVVVSLICGWCAVSYAMVVGVFAETQEQSNGFGAISVVILAAIGGILVPAFAMPDTFQIFLLLSPLHWCLEAFYDLFLERGNIISVLINLARIIIVTILFQILTIYGLKRKNLI